jgi:alpha-mannosidase
MTAPALQRAQRLLQQWVRPQVATGVVPFSVEASAELFEPVAFADALLLPMNPFAVGSPWGQPWHTVWFKFSATVPDGVSGHDLVASIDLGFSGRGDGFQVEGMAWLDGRRVQAVQPDRRLVSLGQRSSGDAVDLWVEATATPIIAGHAFGYAPTPLGDPRTAGSTHLYSLKRAELAVHDRNIEELAGVLHSMIDLVIDSEDDAPQRARLFDLLDRVADVVDVRSLAATARPALDLIEQECAKFAVSTGHSITAVGHAHLDTAWLWPIRETRRKAVRTFANAVRLLEENPDAVFCHSQAQHYAWVLEEAPEIFEQVKRLVKAGRWEPVGGMWVETDLNLPAGESLIRQFVHGRRAFARWFGESSDGQRSSGAFLPDDFGYPATLPQIVRHCQGEWFFTQKLSWNESNRFPHHSFWWEGIDGSRVFAHFSPIETYNALLTPSQLRFAERNFSDHAGASMSLALYGHGDGGGGPTQQMIDRARTSSLWSDLPRVLFGRVDQFFARAVSEYGERAPTWVGEMYLEKHRGTYSSQIATKRGNRRCERLLHEWELWASSKMMTEGTTELPNVESERAQIWQRVLTQQFHDIIPGSSIAWVHRETEDEHRAVAESINRRIDELFGSTSIEGDAPSGEPDGAPSQRSFPSRCTFLANPSPVPVKGVESIDGQPRWIEVPAMSISALENDHVRPEGVDRVAVDLGPNDEVVVSNGIARLEIDANGVVRDIVDVLRSRSIVPSGRFIGLQRRRDAPAEYDAWDIDRADADAPAEDLVAKGSAVVTSSNDLQATVSLDYVLGRSHFTLEYTIKAGEPVIECRLTADWRERETRVQFVLPTDVMARDAVCGVQFGHVRRPRHGNTSWDAAKFEICAHRYVYVSEPGCGIGLVADGPRGYDVRGDALRLTLLRSPSFPDPHCDEGHQVIEWGVYLDAAPGDVGELERCVARRAHPLRQIRGNGKSCEAPVECLIPGVLISAVKPAEDGSGDIIVRMWETRGSRASGSVVVRGAFEVLRADGLEEPHGDVPVRRVDSGDSAFDIDLRAFEIATLRLRRNG